MAQCTCEVILHIALLISLCKPSSLGRGPSCELRAGELKPLGTSRELPLSPLEYISPLLCLTEGEETNKQTNRQTKTNNN